MKIADLLKLWKGASKEEKAELAKIMKEDGEPLPAPVAAVDAAIAKAKADAAEELAKKQVTCPGCAHSFQMAAADKAAAYEASLPENVRKERQADKEKIAKLEADAHDAVMLRKAEAICPPGEDVQVVKGMLIRHAKDPKELEAVEKMFAGVKARAEAADRMLLQQSGNRGRPKPGSAAEEVLTKAEAVAKAKGIPMHKAIDEVESANPDLRDRAYAESRPGAAAQ